MEKVRGWMNKGKGWGKSGKPDKGDGGDPTPDPDIPQNINILLSSPNFSVQGKDQNLHIGFTTDPPTVPTVSSYSPSNGFVGHNPGDNIVLTFSENIQAGAGNITIRVADEGGTFSNQTVIDVTTDIGTGAGQYQISGNTLTINPGTQTAMRRYALRIDATAIDATGGTPSYAGIADDTTYTFVTGTGVTVPTIAGASYSSTVTGQTNPTISSNTKYVNCTFSNICLVRGNDTGPVYLNNIGFDTCSFTNGSGNGMDIKWANDVIVENCTFSNIGGTGLRMQSTGSTNRVTVNGCTFEDINDNGISSAKRSTASPPVDHVDTIINNCVIDNAGVTSGGGGQHGIYLQGTDFTIQNTSVLTAVDGNAISVRTAGTVFNCTINCVSNQDAQGAGIKYFGDHLAGPVAAPRTNDPWFACFNTINGQNDLYNGVEIKKATNSSGGAYTDAEWYINDAHVYENTFSNLTNNNYAFVDWASASYLDIYQDGVLQW